MTKQHKDNIANDAQESLVQALESIKGLLEKSEHSLSAARESISLANTSSRKHKTQQQDEDIPVLNDIVIPSAGEETAVEVDLFATENLAEAEALAEVVEAVTEALPPQGIASEDVLDLVDEFQARIKPLINDAITSSSILKLEQILNEVIEKELHQLRNEIKQLSNS
ncbi:MAG: hypothetical protein PVG18_10290 [Thioalkalispiraceae bacterium]|jgi:hypothetical protein